MTKRPSQTPISPKQEMEIAITLQLLLLNEIFSDSAWRAPNAVFHGGTALALLYNNGRWSEDLDFMIDQEMFSTLDEKLKSAAARLQILARRVYDGCHIDLIGPKGKEDNIKHWKFGWTHPLKRGKVIVKVEFLTKPQKVLSAYQSTQLIPLGRANLPITITSVVHGPRLIASWADKMIAMAERPYFKARDAYDIWFLARRFKELALSDDPDEHMPQPEDEEFVSAVEANAAIYGKDVSAIREGLERRLAGGDLDDLDGYASDMAKWLPASVGKDRGVLQLQLNAAKKEIGRAVRLMENCAPKGPSL